jgi:DNA (cytosine-5)-methyltransferase 1
LITEGDFVNELALFAGAGGGILGGKLLGWRTVCAVEWEPYPASVLCARQNDKIIETFPIWDDVQTFDGKPWRGIVDVVSGGFPCQDISAAGKGVGIDGERSGMWGEMARIIHEVRPRYAFVENSPMLTSRGLGRVLGDLASMGFDARWGVLGAADVGANHQRDRIWIVAKWNGQLPHSQHNRIRRWEQQQESIKKTQYVDNSYCDANISKIERVLGKEKTKQSKNRENNITTWNITRTSNDECRRTMLGLEYQSEESKKHENGEMAYSCNEGLQRYRDEGINDQSIEQEGLTWSGVIGRCGNWWKTEPNVDRVVDGLAARVDRIKAIGNGQVPLCAATAWRILSE